LWRAVHGLAPTAATARLGPWAPLDLRLVQRQQRIHDALRLLAPYLDPDLYHRVRQARPTDQSEEQAHGIASAVTLRAAIAAHRRSMPALASPRAQQLGTDMHDHLDAISAALRRPRLVDSMRHRATSTESQTHA
jgi:hypothetical protein